jgi:cephalosporin-C deacetylase-like acetyl esterase
VRSLPDVDPTKIAVQGISQGGGITLAAAGLASDLVAVMPDIPFLCHFQRAVDICDQDPYMEITRYLSVHRGAETAAFTTLSYFDGVNFAKRASAPALFSVGLWTRSARRRRYMPPITRMAAQRTSSFTRSMTMRVDSATNALPKSTGSMA